MIETWIQCPVCDSKTRVRIREDTVLENFPLYCPKCKHETLISARQLNISVIKEPNHQRDRNTGSFIGYTGSISVPVVFRYDNSFYYKMIQQELAAKHSYNGHSMAENCKSTWHCVQENLPEKAKSISANFYLLVNNRSPIFQHIIVRNTVRC